MCAWCLCMARLPSFISFLPQTSTWLPRITQFSTKNTSRCQKCSAHIACQKGKTCPEHRARQTAECDVTHRKIFFEIWKRRKMLEGNRNSRNNNTNNNNNQEAAVHFVLQTLTAQRTKSTRNNNNTWSKQKARNYTPSANPAVRNAFFTSKCGKI